MSRVAIIDYGLCNLDSIRRAIEICGGKPFITTDPKALQDANHIILPGVGSFGVAMANLKAEGMDQSIREQVKQGVPMLGICLGMQLLASQSTEGGVFEGLGVIPGRVDLLKAATPADRIPHVGWNSVTIEKAGDPLFRDTPADTNFYFVHSYHLQPDDAAWAAGSTPFCGTFTSVVRRDNVAGTQFHPEKSQRAGFRLLKNFLAQ